VLTPNGDDVNDAVAVSFDLFGIDRAAMKVEVYDLAGRRLVALLDDIGEAGPYRPTWDGRDTQGKIAAPGLYVLRVEVKVDEDTFTKSTPIAVSY
jgi:flagellar hook assembly protein FlgD